MITKQGIIRMAREVFRHSQGRRSRELMHPVREWFIGLGVFLAVAGVGSAWVWSEYSFYKALSPIGGQVDMEIANYHEAAVTAALNRYSEKQQVYEELVSAEPLADLEEAGDSGELATTTITTSNTEEDETAEQAEVESSKKTNTVPEGESSVETNSETAVEPTSPQEPPIGEPLIGE